MSFLGKCYSCDREVWSDDGPELYMCGGECNSCAGEVLCRRCKKTTIYRDDGEECKNCEVNEFEDELCEKCMMIDQYECGSCDKSLCDICFERDCAENAEKYPCCRMHFCKDCLKEGEHELEKDRRLNCGHNRCNFTPEGIDCLACHDVKEDLIEKRNRKVDKKSVETLLEQTKSRLGKELLQNVIKELEKSIGSSLKEDGLDDNKCRNNNKKRKAN